MKRCLARLFPFSWRELVISAAILLAANGLCILLRTVDGRGDFSSLIFVLAVLLVSRNTTGYLFGLASSVIGVICVNYIFTYPYLAINFTIAGYPLTFFVMLMVSIMTCAMTNQIRQQEHLRAESEKETVRANLLRSVSHDIRTPLTSIIGAASTILEGEEVLSPEEKRQLLLDVRSEAQWLIQVVENLLSVTRMGDEQAHISKKPEAAEEIMGEALRKFRKRFPDMAVSVSVPEALLMVPMDAILIEQVLANLMENAVRHGRTTTALRLCVLEEEKYARFSVQDNGQGITPELLPQLFQGGVRRGEDRSVDGKRNMGLGLQVCQAIVHAHGGTISARNLPEGGAELSFRLPMQ